MTEAKEYESELAEKYKVVNDSMKRNALAEVEDTKIHSMQLLEQVTRERDEKHIIIMQLEKNMHEADVKHSSELSATKTQLGDTLLKLANLKTVLAEQNSRIDELESEQQKRKEGSSELEITLRQRDMRVQELEVQARHHDVRCREIEAKTARELERLRTHLIATEEKQTQEILDAEEREKSLKEELKEAKELLNNRSHTYQSSREEWGSHMSDMEEQVKTLSLQKEHLQTEMGKYQQKSETNIISIRNLERALAQLQREKEEQFEYMSEKSRQELVKAQAKINELQEKEHESSERIEEANLAVQGVA